MRSFYPFTKITAFFVSFILSSYAFAEPFTHCHSEISRINLQLAQTQAAASQALLDAQEFNRQALFFQQRAKDKRSAGDDQGADQDERFFSSMDRSAQATNRSFTFLSQQASDLYFLRQTILKNCK